MLLVKASLLHEVILKDASYGGNGVRRQAERRRRQQSLSNDQLEALLLNALKDYCCAKKGVGK